MSSAEHERLLRRARMQDAALFRYRLIGPALEEGLTTKQRGKVVRGIAEEGRIAIRNVRRDVMSNIKEALKEKLISQDDERRAETDVQKLTDKHVADIDQMLAAKEKEIMQV